MKHILLLIACSFILLLNSCTHEFLDIKPSQDLVIPSALQDFQALMDAVHIMNNHTGLQTISTDNFNVINDEDLLATLPNERNAYLWEREIYEGEEALDWKLPYLAIFYANVVLEGLNDIIVTNENRSEWNRLKGSALFYRAISYYHMTQLFAAPYDEHSSDLALGLPIRRTANVNVIEKRSTLKETYEHIIENLLEAEQLLPVEIPYKTRPSKPAALALLARVYLSMEHYELALLYANHALQLKGDLIDYNSVDTTNSTSFPLAIPYGNEEVIYYVPTGILALFHFTSTSVNEELYNSYDVNDLRRYVFFFRQPSGAIGFKGNYTGHHELFAGLAADELYLIKAETSARTGDYETAMNTLNELLINRYIQGEFTPLVATDANDALQIVLNERRKELVWRGQRWTDLRRLNKDERFQKTLKRTFQGKEYILPPNDKRYVFPIPDNEVSFSGIEQNER